MLHGSLTPPNGRKQGGILRQYYSGNDIGHIGHSIITF